MMSSSQLITRVGCIPNFGTKLTILLKSVLSMEETLETQYDKGGVASTLREVLFKGPYSR